MRKLSRTVRVLGLAFVPHLWSKKGTAADSEPPSDYELKLVQVLFRHGARTPLKSIPGVMEAQWLPSLLEPPAHTQINYVVTNLEGGPKPPAPVEDSYRRNTLTGGTFPGQLTTLGMQQLYELGLRLRLRYVEESRFLSPAFNCSEVYVRSTNIVRTIESARCLLAGLFLQRQNDVVPILTSEAESEILYPNPHGCELLRIIGGHRLKESSSLPGIAEDLLSIQSALGIAANCRVDFTHIRDDLVARKAHGLPCPAVLDTWSSKVEQRAVDTICCLYKPDKSMSLQLCVGPLLHIVLKNMDEKLSGTADRKLFLYSAHDTTLIPCLMALGVFDMQWPPYAADITLELHQHRQTKEARVKVSYLGKDQLIPGCSGVYCPLEEFKRALSAYSLSPELYKSLCENTEGLTEP